MSMTGPQIIVLATPVFLLLIAIEWWIGRRRGRNTYRLNDALNSIGLGVMSQLAGVFSALLTLGIYTLVFDHAAPWRLPDILRMHTHHCCFPSTTRMEHCGRASVPVAR